MSERRNDVLLWLAGAWFLSQVSWSNVRKATRAAAKKLQPAMPTKLTPFDRFGALFYDFTHSDSAHQQDLPGKTYNREGLLRIATSAGFPDPKLAAAIALAESGGVSGAMVRSSREYSVGLWQINTMAHPQYAPEAMKDPLKNARAAFELTKGGTDWSRWTTYKSGKYRQYKTGALA